MKHSLRLLAPANRFYRGSAFLTMVLLAAATLVPQAVQAQVVFDDFNDGVFDDIFVFSGGDAGIGSGPTEGQDGTPNAGLSIGINPGSGGNFAGFGVPGAAGTTDISGTEYLTFYYRPTSVQAANLPLTLEINLQEDVNGDGVFDNGGTTEDEFRASYRLLPTAGAGYQLIEIPLEAFADQNANTVGANDGLDFSNILQIVFAFGGIPAGPEFTFAIDELAFASTITVSNESDASGQPDAIVLGSAYPNPFTAQSRFEVTLDRAQSVRIELFDVLGRQVGRLYEGTLAAQTPHAFEIDGRDLPSGMYLYRVTGETFAQTRSLVLLK